MYSLKEDLGSTCRRRFRARATTPTITSDSAPTSLQVQPGGDAADPWPCNAAAKSCEGKDGLLSDITLLRNSAEVGLLCDL